MRREEDRRTRPGKREDALDGDLCPAVDRPQKVCNLIHKLLENNKIHNFYIEINVVAVIQSLSHVQLFATLWTVACQAPLSMGFSRQESWSGLSCPPPGDLPDPGIKLASLTSPALEGRLSTTSASWEAQSLMGPLQI